MRPPHVACAVSLQPGGVCVWGAGGPLVARDVWGRWMLLGLGVRGPGCGAPSRYLDMMSYYPWVEKSLDEFNKITISKISKQKYVLRSSHNYQRFGNCDAEEKTHLAFRETIVLRTDNSQYQYLTYNITLLDNIEYTCMTMELVNASAVSEMRIKHFCNRVNFGAPCYFYRGSSMELSVYIMFSDKCLFELFVWGFNKNMTLLDIQEWKWEEGTYYDDFTMQRVEYRGPSYMTDYGYEPLDSSIWVPEYDIWTTTLLDNSTTPTPPPVKVSRPTPTRPTTTVMKTKPTPKRKTKPRPTTRRRTQRPRRPTTRRTTIEPSKSYPSNETTTIASTATGNTSTSYPSNETTTIASTATGNTSTSYPSNETTTVASTTTEETIDSAMSNETTTVASTTTEETIDSAMSNETTTVAITSTTVGQP
ncbi:unnamed protein product [Spodoptera littoralis]|uniref:Peptidase S1 domain-containing protein n=1 Tax=Spodoptera littoralis TaxID=7109 RepID=A0A9P0N548_SPOLI|nr:unnamed protein product [Spodoptera littoralis]CAH1641898.1 unnamed protein product [Spodoptera littoralis]